LEEQMNQEESEVKGTFSSWMQDNMRIIISILIVVAIAGGIYSYSKRSQVALETETGQGLVSQVGDETNSKENIVTQDKGTAPEEKQVKEQKSTPKEEKTAVKPTGAASNETSQETSGSFIETAGRGDGTTHLARRALANYLEKSPDSALTPEHKIYIEDYLRKHVGQKGSVHIGTSVEFSKDLISNAISQANKLNDAQLKNLHKYAIMVPSLS
jgi:hypothetical protein